MGGDPSVAAHGMRLEWLDPRTLEPNPRNARSHPQTQRQSLKAGLDELGWLAALTLNARSGRLIDGHLRRQQAIEDNVELVPVLVLDLDPDDEAAALASLDTIGAMARTDDRAFNALLQDTPDGLALLLRSTASAPREVEDADLRDDAWEDKLQVGLVPGEQFHYVVLLFRTEIDFLNAQAHFGLERVRDPFHETQKGVARVIDGGAYLRKQNERDLSRG